MFKLLLFTGNSSNLFLAKDSGSLSLFMFKMNSKRRVLADKKTSDVTALFVPMKILPKLKSTDGRR